MQIREARTQDHQRLVEIYNHYVTHTAITFDLATFSVASRGAWFAQFDASTRHRLVVGETDSGLIGYACSTPLRPKAAYDRSVETTIYLDPDHTGAGLGVPLYRGLLALLAETDVHRCYAVITQPNEPSMALHARLGYAEVGRLSECGHKFQRWWDVVWMERALP